MKALTVHNPWAWAIAHGGKDIENRTWTISAPGDVAVHAGLTLDRQALGHPLIRAATTRWLGGRSPVGVLPWEQSIGAVIAVVAVVGAHRNCDGSCSPWAVLGQWHWRLANVRPLPEPVPARGAQQLWPLPDDVEAAVRTQLAAVAS